MGHFDRGQRHHVDRMPRELGLEDSPGWWPPRQGAHLDRQVDQPARFDHAAAHGVALLVGSLDHVRIAAGRGDEEVVHGQDRGAVATGGVGLLSVLELESRIAAFFGPAVGDIGGARQVLDLEAVRAGPVEPHPDAGLVREAILVQHVCAVDPLRLRRQVDVLAGAGNDLVLAAVEEFDRDDARFDLVVGQSRRTWRIGLLIEGRSGTCRQFVDVGVELRAVHGDDRARSVRRGG
jgi:hypothetical protein